MLISCSACRARCRVQLLFACVAVALLPCGAAHATKDPEETARSATIAREQAYLEQYTALASLKGVAGRFALYPGAVENHDFVRGSGTGRFRFVDKGIEIELDALDLTAGPRSALALVGMDDARNSNPTVFGFIPLAIERPPAMIPSERLFIPLPPRLRLSMLQVRLAVTHPEYAEKGPTVSGYTWAARSAGGLFLHTMFYAGRGPDPCTFTLHAEALARIGCPRR